MPDVLDAAFLLAGFVCFVLAAIGVATRVNLVATGLACWLLPTLAAAIVAL